MRTNKYFFINRIVKKIIIFCLVIILYSLAASSAYATNYIPDYSGTNSGITCPDWSGCIGATCWNSASVGVTDCGNACDGGNAWSKYNFSGCFYISPNN